MLLGLSFTAALLTTGAFVPQVVRTVRHRTTDDFAWAYLALFGAGVAMWCVYGAVRGDAALFVANAVTLSLVSILAWVKHHGARS
jgi:MtN3 and saliva related transmembrane protein